MAVENLSVAGYFDYSSKGSSKIEIRRVDVAHLSNFLRASHMHKGNCDGQFKRERK